jgi:hypothetical protein
MIISKDLEWTREYIESVKSLVPDIVHLRRITSIHGRRDVQLGCFGQLWKYKNNHYRMSLYLNYYSFKKKTYLSTVEILSNLSHELAHVSHFYHTTDHKILESTLTIMFMTKLKAEGYQSEEVEMRNIK